MDPHYTKRDSLLQPNTQDKEKPLNVSNDVVSDTPEESSKDQTLDGWRLKLLTLGFVSSHYSQITTR